MKKLPGQHPKDELPTDPNSESLSAYRLIEDRRRNDKPASAIPSEVKVKPPSGAGNAGDALTMLQLAN